MHYGRIASLAAAALTAVVALGTVPIRAAEPAVVELLGMFITICLERFPDDDAVKQFANEKRLEAMTEEHIRHLLGKHPGTGWIHNSPQGRYVLTIEFPPYHTCAIRKADRVAPDFLPPLSQILGNWAARQSGASLRQLPKQEVQIGGMPSQVYKWELDRGPGTKTEGLMAIITNGPNMVETRLARAVGDR